MEKRVYKAESDKLHDVLSFIESKLEEKECNLKAQMMITVMVEEIFINIASYAYPNSSGETTICLDFDDKDNVVITFVDNGIEFNPLEKEDPDITLSAEERKIGGLGIYMVKKTMDDVIYERKDGNNILTIKKGIH